MSFYVKILFLVLVISLLSYIGHSQYENFVRERYYNHIDFNNDAEKIDDALGSVKEYLESNKGKSDTTHNIYISYQGTLVIDNGVCGNTNDSKVMLCDYWGDAQFSKRKEILDSLIFLRLNNISGGYQYYHSRSIVFPYKEYTNNNTSYNDTRELIFKNDYDIGISSSHTVIDSNNSLYLIMPNDATLN